MAVIAKEISWFSRPKWYFGLPGDKSPLREAAALVAAMKRKIPQVTRKAGITADIVTTKQHLEIRRAMPLLRHSFSNAGSLIKDADHALHQIMVDRVKETFGNALPIKWDGNATKDLVQLFSNAMAFFRLLHEQRSNTYVEAPD